MLFDSASIAALRNIWIPDLASPLQYLETSSSEKSSTLSNSVDLYGLIYKKAGSYALYHPWDLVKSGLGLTE